MKPGIYFQFVVLLAIVFSASLQAQQTYKWKGGTAGWSTSSNWDPEGVPSTTDNVEISSGHVIVSGETSVGGLTVTNANLEILDGEALYVQNEFFWGGGLMIGEGLLSLELLCQGAIAGDGIFQLQAGFTFENNGQLTWSSGKMSNQNGSRFVNNGNMDMAIVNENHDIFTLAKFENNGFLTKSLPGRTSLFSEFTNNGMVNVQTGMLSIYGKDKSPEEPGTYIIGESGKLEFDGVGRTLTTSSSLTGEGDVHFAGNTVEICGEYAVDSTVMDEGYVEFRTGSLVELNNLRFEKGSLDGTDSMVVSNSIEWSGGSINDTIILTALESCGSVIDPGGSINLHHKARFYNFGLATWTNGSFSNNTGTRFYNYNELVIAGEVYYRGHFHNMESGKLTIMVPETVEFLGDIVNDGAIDIQMGNFRIDQSGSKVATHSGSISIGHLAELRLGNGNKVFGEHSSITSTGGWVIFDLLGESIFNGDFTVDSVATEDGTATFNTPVDITHLQMTGGVLQGDETVTVKELFYWESPGAMKQEGVTIFDEGCETYIFGDTRNISDHRRLINYGNVCWYSGKLQLSSTAIIDNYGRIECPGPASLRGGSFFNHRNAEITVDNSGVNRFFPSKQLVNNGIVTVGNADLEWGSSNMSTDSGTYAIEQYGRLDLFTGNRKWTDSVLVKGNGNIAIADPNVLEDNATYSPGFSAGKLTIEGDYLPLGDGGLDIGIGGYTPADSYDQLEVTGHASLAGMLEIRLLDDFIPDDLDTFNVLYYDTYAGAFDTIAGPEGFTIVEDYLEHRLRITFIENRDPVYKEMELDFPGFSPQNMHWVDHDGDGDYDLSMSGMTGIEQPYFEIMENSGGHFTANTPEVIVHGRNHAWIDYNMDGYPDLMVNGRLNQEVNSFIYENNEGVFDGSGLQFVQDVFSSFDFGDLDGNGTPDFIYTSSGTNGVPLVKLLLNKNGKFDTSLDLPQLTAFEEGFYQFIDVDSDGDTDIFGMGLDVEGVLTSLMLINEGNEPETGLPRMFAVESGIPPMRNASVSWGDYNGDGYPDMLLCGDDETDEERVSLLMNVSEGQFLEIMGSEYGDFMKLSGAKGAFTDYDNDGDLDIFLSGLHFEELKVYSLLYAQHDTGFSTVYSGLEDFSGKVVHGDMDLDGDMDMAYAGLDENYDQQVSGIYENVLDIPNQAPAVPGNIKTVVDEAGVKISWDRVDDPENTPESNTYNLRVGTAPGLSDIVSPVADPSGFKMLARPGNVLHSTDVILSDLAPGTTYYVSLQAVDHNFLASAFTGDFSFVTGDTSTVNTAEAAISLIDLRSYPNPSRERTVVSYTLDQPGVIALDLLDINGTIVRTLVNGYRGKGEHHQVLYSADLPAGTYLLRFTRDHETKVATVLVVN